MSRGKYRNQLDVYEFELKDDTCVDAIYESHAIAMIDDIERRVNNILELFSVNDFQHFLYNIEQVRDELIKLSDDLY